LPEGADSFPFLSEPVVVTFALLILKNPLLDGPLIIPDFKSCFSLSLSLIISYRLDKCFSEHPRAGVFDQFKKRNRHHN
jgi:hypothetical protein